MHLWGEVVNSIAWRGNLDKVKGILLTVISGCIIISRKYCVNVQGDNVAPLYINAMVSRWQNGCSFSRKI